MLEPHLFFMHPWSLSGSWVRFPPFQSWLSWAVKTSVNLTSHVIFLNLRSLIWKVRIIGDLPLRALMRIKCGHVCRALRTVLGWHIVLTAHSSVNNGYSLVPFQTHIHLCAVTHPTQIREVNPSRERLPTCIQGVLNWKDNSSIKSRVWVLLVFSTLAALTESWGQIIMVVRGYSM